MSRSSILLFCLLLTACDKEAPKSAPSPRPSASEPASAASASSRVEDPTFVLEFLPPDGCKAGADCAATLKLSALGEFHINDEGFPYRFVADDTPNVTFLSKEPDGHTFSLKAGDFKQQAEKLATMEVRFRPAAAGKLKIAGRYNMAVCTKANCKPIHPNVAVDVTVM